MNGNPVEPVQQVSVSKFDNILLCYWLMVAFINVQYFV